MPGFKRLLWLAALSAWAYGAPVIAGDPETCAYQDESLARACADDPGVRAYLLKPANALIERLADIPPAVRGWLPGEEAAVILSIQNEQAGCGYFDRDLALACRLDDRVRSALQKHGRGADTTWFVLPPEVGGWAANTTNPNIPRPYNNEGATRQRYDWTIGYPLPNEERIAQIERAITRATGREVRAARAFLVAVDGINFVACGYGFYKGDGELLSAGLFVFDSRGGSALRAPPALFVAKCQYADRVLR